MHLKKQEVIKMANDNLEMWSPDDGWKPTKNKHTSSDDIYDDDESSDDLKYNNKKLTIGGDVLNSLYGAPSYIKNALLEAPHEINEGIHMPLGRSLKNIGQGIENTALLPINLGAQLSDYLKNKDIPYLNKIADYYPHIPKHDLFGLGEPQAGDAFWQMIAPGGVIGKASKGLYGIKALSARAGALGTYAASQGENPIQAALLGSALESMIKGAGKTQKLYGAGKGAYSNFKESFNTKELEPKVKSYKEKLMEVKEKEELIKKQADEAKEKLDKSKNKAMNRNLSTNPERLRGQITTEERNIRKLENINTQPKQLDELNLPEIPPSHEYELKSAKTSDDLKLAEQKKTQAESNLKEHLGEDQIYHERFAIEARNELDKIEQKNKENYDKIDKPLNDNKIIIKNPVEAKDVADHVNRILNEHDIWSDEVSNLPNEIEEMNRHEEIPAKKYMQLYRKSRDASLDAYHQMKELGGSSTEAGEAAYKRWTKLKSLTDKMYGHLEKSLPKETFKSLEDAQNYFKDVVSTLRQSKLGRDIKYKGKVGKNILEDLIGNDIGQDQFRRLVDENPELRRLLIAQQAKGKLDNLHKPNEALRRYIDNSPEIKKLIEEHRSAQKTHQEATERHEQAIFYDTENQKQAVKREEERSKLIEKNKNEKEKHEKQQELNIKESQEEQTKIKNGIEESTKKINTYKKQIDILRKRSSRAESKLKEKLLISNEVKNLEKKLNDAEKMLNERKEKWNKVRSSALKLYGIKSLITNIAGI